MKIINRRCQNKSGKWPQRSLRGRGGGNQNKTSGPGAAGLEPIKIIKVPEQRLLFEEISSSERRGRDSIKITQVAPEINTAAGVHLGKASMAIRYRMSKTF